ncbi:MAG: sensor domain-containing diguanylate cyclase [Pelosinus sp.]|nr:sensor domain-containing diguanylate cyclase [Pelosinus sp.]
MEKSQSLHYYREIMNHSRDIILILRTDGTIIDANDTAVKSYGYSLPELKALTFEDLRAPAARPLAALQSHTAISTKIFSETNHRRKDGSIFPVEVTSHRLIFAVENLFINIIRDITEHIQIRKSLCQELENIKKIQQELLIKNLTLERLASTDRLTGLGNRRHFETIMLGELERTNRYHLPLSLILLDIDYFKHFNDNYGHQTGDDILIIVTSLIQEQLRTSDVFARWGGDEFIILLPNTNTQAALQTAEKIRGIIEACKVSPAEAVTLSLGVAEYIENEMISAWIKRADTALYLAKKSGRNSVKTAV